MAVLYGNYAFSILVRSTKNGTPLFWKKFSFSKLKFQFQSQSIEIVQNFHWLSHRDISISQTEGYFENP